MTTEINIQIKNKKNPPALKFPDQCVSCASSDSLQQTIKVWLNLGVQKRSRQVMMEIVIPMCNPCAEKERSITKVTLVPFYITGFLIFMIVFIIVWLITPDGTSSQTLGFSMAVGVLAGMIAGVIGGTLVEFGLKFVFMPVYGQILKNRPLTVFSLFNDSEDVIGLSIKFTDQKKILKLTFENDDIARKFTRLNPSEKI